MQTIKSLNGLLVKINWNKPFNVWDCKRDYLGGNKVDFGSIVLEKNFYYLVNLFKNNVELVKNVYAHKITFSSFKSLKYH